MFNLYLNMQKSNAVIMNFKLYSLLSFFIIIFSFNGITQAESGNKTLYYNPKNSDGYIRVDKSGDEASTYNSNQKGTSLRISCPAGYTDYCGQIPNSDNGTYSQSSCCVLNTTNQSPKGLAKSKETDGADFSKFLTDVDKQTISNMTKDKERQEELERALAERKQREAEERDKRERAAAEQRAAAAKRERDSSYSNSWHSSPSYSPSPSYGHPVW